MARVPIPVATPSTPHDFLDVDLANGHTVPGGANLMVVKWGTAAAATVVIAADGHQATGITASETYTIPSAAGGTQVAIFVLDSTRFGTNPTVDVTLTSPDWVSLVAFTL